MRIRDGWTNESADDIQTAWMDFLLPDQSVTGALHDSLPVHREFFLTSNTLFAEHQPHFVEFSDSSPKWPR